ncbi:MAG: hypothetical protein DRG69_05305 [Deltaproteobacteria bacterium]|nr:MAG: hypothetical protein DRG69_05305 [Deltaproteobacteria bacterium]
MEDMMIMLTIIPKQGTLMIYGTLETSSSQQKEKTYFIIAYLPMKDQVVPHLWDGEPTALIHL